MVAPAFFRWGPAPRRLPACGHDSVALRPALSELGEEAEAVFVQSKPSSRVLGDNLEAQGIQRPADSAAHHVVAGQDPRAAESRAILNKFGIDINDPDNGVFLPQVKESPAPGAYHRSLHTDKYYDNLNKALRDAQSAEEAREILKDISERLLGDIFPH